MNLRRKRYVLMNSGVWKGHIRNISGNPVTLDKAMGLQTLEVLGNSIQDGTPSPDNPVEVVGVGEKTLNLFNPDIIWTNNYYIDSTGSITYNTYTYFDSAYSQVVELNAGIAYTAGIFKPTNSIDHSAYCRVFSCNKDGENRVQLDFANNAQNNVVLNFESPTGYIILSVTREKGTLIDTTLKNVMIVEGEYTADTLPPYEPYGYKVPVSVEKQNIKPQTLNIYTPQILHGLGDVSDTVVLDFNNRRAELVQNVVPYEFRKTWTIGTTGTNIITQRFYQSGEIKGNSRIMSEIFKELTPSSAAIFFTDQEGINISNGPYLQLRVNKQRLNSIDSASLNDWISNYNESHGEIKNYTVSTINITTDISDLQDWDNMPDISGTIILTANSTAEPTLNVNYYSTVKE